MTHQQSERIFYDGEERWLFSTPLEPYLDAIDYPPELGGWNTSLRRRYIGSWALDDGMLALTGIDGTYLNLTRVEGLAGWVGLSGHRPRGKGPVMPDAGFAELPLPDRLKRFPLDWDLRWMTFGNNEVTLGVPASIVEGWISTPDLEIEIAPAARGLQSYKRKDGYLGARNVGAEEATVRRLRVSDATQVDSTASVSFFELRNLWIDLDDADRSEWARFAVRGPDADGEIDWLEKTCCFVSVDGGRAWRDLSKLAVYRPDPRPVEIGDLFRGQRAPIPATWFSGDLRIVDGAQISFSRAGFESVYEIETFLTIEQGRHTGTRIERHAAPPEGAGRRPSSPLGASSTMGRPDL